MFNSIRNRLLLLILLYLFLVILVITIIISNSYMQDRKNQSIRYFQQRIHTSIELMDTVIYRLDTLSTQLLASNTLQEMFSYAKKSEYAGKNYFEHNLEQKKIAQDILWAFNSPKTQAQNVSIFSESTYLGLRYSPTVSKILEVSSQPFFAVPEEQPYAVIPPHKDYWSDFQDSIVFSLVRPFIATNLGFVQIGTIEVMESYEVIEDIFDIGESDAGLSFLVIDEQNRIIHTTMEQDQDDLQSLKTMMNEQKAGDIITISLHDDTYIMAFGELASIGWRILLLQPKSIYDAPLRTLTKQLILLIACITIAIFLVMIFIVQKVTKPLEQLSYDIDRFSLYEKPVVHPCNLKEIKDIQQTFLRLVERLQESTDQLLLANETELNLRIMSLQSQVNPHFLFNSLTAISAASYEEGSVKVPVMCKQLSELFRYSSSGSDSETSLKDEVDNVRTYMDFMTWRYETLFSYTIHVIGDLQSIRIPRLILQPMVENSFTHGFKHAYPPYHLDLTCEVSPGGWHLEISDSGAGFSNASIIELSSLFNSIDRILSKRNSYEELKAHDKALVNLYIRLRLLYKDAFTFHISNGDASRGARIVIDVRDTAERRASVCSE